MHMVNMHQAKSTLSQLVEAALSGEEVVIARNGQPMVRLVPVNASSERLLRPIGLGSSGKPLIANSEFELMASTNPDVFDENPSDPMNAS
jgi:prevent-host-death family protein